MWKLEEGSGEVGMSGFDLAMLLLWPSQKPKSQLPAWLEAVESVHYVSGTYFMRLQRTDQP